MRAQLLDRINSIVTWAKRSQRVPTKGNPVKVNFGSSLFVADGWINVDGAPYIFFAGWPTLFIKCAYRLSRAQEWFGPETRYVSVLKTQSFVHHDLRYGLPFKDSSVDYIYASHIIEHFYRDTARAILRDAHRVLKRGGRLRVCVPDLEYAIRLYLTGDREKSLELFFHDSDAGPFYRHKYMYDFSLLQSTLVAVGFEAVERSGYHEGKVPDLEKLDNRPEQTLYVEAMK
jgi:predicted SAM-dependent methyltransferase